MNNRTSTIGISTFIITAVMAGPVTGQSDIPAHPDDLRFEPLVFSPPSSADYRYELPGGTPVYMVIDKLIRHGISIGCPTPGKAVLFSCNVTTPQTKVRRDPTALPL